MSATQILLLALAAWVVIGLVAAFLMGRRGHDPFRWWMLGAVFGPLVLVLAIEGVLAEKESVISRTEAGRAGEGPVRVLVGIDGSPESTAALRAVTDLLGPRIERLTLATVVPFEGVPPGSDPGSELTAAVPAVAPFYPATVVLQGEPSHELIALAERDGYDVLVVGNRGKGFSKMLTGSVAHQLLSNEKVAVMVLNRWRGLARRGTADSSGTSGS